MAENEGARLWISAARTDRVRRYWNAQLFGLVNVVVEAMDNEDRVVAHQRSQRKGKGHADQPEVLWKLVHMCLKGEDFWVDRQTNLVYTPAPEGDWPRLHGKLKGVEAIDTSFKQMDLFQSLGVYLKVRSCCIWNPRGRFRRPHIATQEDYGQTPAPISLSARLPLEVCPISVPNRL